jgi:hypothetical protein
MKYGCEGFEIRNNFPYRNYSRFEMYFELKIMEASRVWISMKIDELFLGSSRFDEIWGKGTSLHLDDNLTHEKDVGVSKLWVS